MGTNESSTEFDAKKYLPTPDEARFFLKSCIRDDEGNGYLIRAAVNLVDKSGNLEAILSETDAKYEYVRDAMSKDDPPSFDAVTKLVRALGMKIEITE